MARAALRETESAPRRRCSRYAAATIATSTQVGAANAAARSHQGATDWLNSVRPPDPPSPAIPANWSSARARYGSRYPAVRGATTHNQVTTRAAAAAVSAHAAQLTAAAERPRTDLTVTTDET